jgi:hypothetical protein
VGHQCCSVAQVYQRKALTDTSRKPKRRDRDLVIGLHR